MFSSLGSKADFPEYILMIVSDRFIHNFEVAIKGWKKYATNLDKSFWGEGWEDHFEVKLRSEACHLDFQNILHNRLC